MRIRAHQGGPARAAAGLRSPVRVPVMSALLTRVVGPTAKAKLPRPFLLSSTLLLIDFLEEGVHGFFEFISRKLAVLVPVPNDALSVDNVNRREVGNAPGFHDAALGTIPPVRPGHGIFLKELLQR